jgi:hypothetical protein
LVGGGPAAQGNAEAEGNDERDGSKQKRAGQGLPDNFCHRPAPEFQRIAEVAAQNVEAVTEELLGEGPGEAVLFLQHGLGAGIEGAFRGERGTGGDADKQEAKGQHREDHGNRGQKAAGEERKHLG